MSRAWLKIASDKVSIDVESLMSVSQDMLKKYLNALKSFAYFIIISNTLVCIMVGFTPYCPVPEGSEEDCTAKCSNWFFYFMQGE